MMDEEKQQVIRQRMEEARETLVEAGALLTQDPRRGTINRSYYAMFYAVLALAASRGLAVSKHTHVIAFFDKEFVRKGIFPKELSRALHYGFEERQSKDYGENREIERADAETALSDAKNFIDVVENFVKNL